EQGQQLVAHLRVVRQRLGPQADGENEPVLAVLDDLEAHALGRAAREVELLLAVVGAPVPARVVLLQQPHHVEEVERRLERIGPAQRHNMAAVSTALPSCVILQPQSPIVAPTGTKRYQEPRSLSKTPLSRRGGTPRDAPRFSRDAAGSPGWTASQKARIWRPSHQMFHAVYPTASTTKAPTRPASVLTIFFMMRPGYGPSPSK